MFVFYGSVRGAPAVSPFIQVLRITGPDEGTVDPQTGETVVNNHGRLIWAGTGEGLQPSVYNSGEWTVTFTRGELGKSNYGGTDTSTNTVTAVINRTDGTVRFVYLNKGYVAEGINAYRMAYHMFAGGEEVEGYSGHQVVEFVPNELYGSETGFTDPPEGSYIEALEENGAGGGESNMSEVNEILVKSYLNLERDPVNEYHAASKNYVDTVAGVVNNSLTAHSGSTTIHVPTQNTAGYVFLSNTTTTSAGTWTAYGTAGTDVASGGTKLVTGGAVYAYLNSHYSAFTDKSLATSVANNNANPVTSGAVYTYVQSTLLNKSGSTGASALDATSDVKAPSSKLVSQYVTKAISDAACDYAGASHTHSGADITSGTVSADRLPKGNGTETSGIVKLASSSGLDLTSGTLGISAGNGLEIDDGDLQVKPAQNGYLTSTTAGVSVAFSTLKADLIGTTEGKAPALDSAGKLSMSVMPARVIGGEYLGEVSNQAGMIAKSGATVGDFVKRTDKGTYWMLGVDGDNAYATAANWFEYAGAVASVNGQVGTVSLSASDVSAIASSALVTTVASTSTDAKVPSALAVYTFVNTNYAPKTHNHAASEITSGTLAAARLPDASTSAKGGVILAKAASSGTTDVTNDSKAVTPKAAKQIADAAAASATAAAAKGKIFTITGDGSATNFTCTHGLGISDVLVQVYDADGKQVWVATEKTATTVVFKFASAPSASTTFTAVILGVVEAA